MIDTQHEENLLVVFAVEEYARRHGISAYDTLGLFLKYGITESIRQCYDTLHTQDIYECVSFAEDILKRKRRCHLFEIIMKIYIFLIRKSN
jgi:hypothetical protein